MTTTTIEPSTSSSHLIPSVTVDTPDAQASLPGFTNSHARPPISSTTPGPPDAEDTTAWGSNFWVTLVDPQTQTAFYACPATGQVSWDPPAGNFVLPPSEEGEWWELADDSRGGLPYYYQTKTGQTVWERPEGFVIPLGILQNTALGRRLSSRVAASSQKPSSRADPSQSTQTMNGNQRPRSKQSSSPSTKRTPPSTRRSFNLSADSYSRPPNSLTPIPGSDFSAPTTPSSRNKAPSLHSKNSDSPTNKTYLNGIAPGDGSPRSRTKSSSYIQHRSPQPQSLSAALELLSSSQSDSGHGSLTSLRQVSDSSPSLRTPPNPTTPEKNRSSISPSPRRPIPAAPLGGQYRARNVSTPTVGGKGISAPILNPSATLDMSPVKNRASGRPIPIDARAVNGAKPSQAPGSYPALPSALVSDIQLFSESDYAKQYFSTHRRGFIFRRRVPVAQMMTWQKAPLGSSLLTLTGSLNKDAVKIFRVIQYIMGDRERERNLGGRITETQSTVTSFSVSTSSFGGSGMLEQERWLLGEGLRHGELRDEIYCQLMKQLTGNPTTESLFKGWQLLCVLLITFPPSKNFETYLRSFIHKHNTQQEGRVDVMAKYCLRKLAYISKKGPRGKPPTTAEIETASDAAFNPSTFGESLDAIVRLQERNYPQQKVPIILPFLADGILALGGTKAEGIFRVPGDGDSVSELKLRIDKGYYTLDNVDDPHTLASLMKLWLRELCDPLVPEEMYNECIANSKDAESCIRIVERLPTINRRVVLFVISFLQLFLEERTQSVTKMTPANLALVMAPNLLRCNSESMTVVFTNAQYEQIFVYNLLLHLKCGEVDGNYTPAHGLGAVPTATAARASKSKSRRP